jgi:hypothetical protein
VRDLNDLELRPPGPLESDLREAGREARGFASDIVSALAAFLLSCWGLVTTLRSIAATPAHEPAEEFPQGTTKGSDSDRGEES